MEEDIEYWSANQNGGVIIFTQYGSFILLFNNRSLIKVPKRANFVYACSMLARINLFFYQRELCWMEGVSLSQSGEFQFES